MDHELELRFDVDEGLEWIREHPEIRDVRITGGDLFLLSNDRIEYLITKIREIPHVEMTLFGTRTVIALPQRMESGLLKVLSGIHKVPIWINTQCNHPRELTPETAEVVCKLMGCGINVGNQAVLLKDINDDVATFKELHLKLLQFRIRPCFFTEFPWLLISMPA